VGDLIKAKNKDEALWGGDLLPGRKKKQDRLVLPICGLREKEMLQSKGEGRGNEKRKKKFAGSRLKLLDEKGVRFALSM